MIQKGKVKSPYFVYRNILALGVPATLLTPEPPLDRFLPPPRHPPLLTSMPRCTLPVIFRRRSTRPRALVPPLPAVFFFPLSHTAPDCSLAGPLRATKTRFRRPSVPPSYLKFFFPINAWQDSPTFPLSISSMVNFRPLP